MSPKILNSKKRGKANRRAALHHCLRVAASLLAVLIASLFLFRRGPEADATAGAAAPVPSGPEVTGAAEALSVALARAREAGAVAADPAPLAAAMEQLGAVLAAAARPNDEEGAAVEQSGEATAAYEVYSKAALYSFRAIQAMPPRASETTRVLWLAATCFAFTHVMPEFQLAADNVEAHSEALVRGLHLLMMASNAFSGVAILRLDDCVPHAYEAYATEWMKFCSSTFASAGGMELRRSAVLEELIALYPDFGPLRMHYAVTITLAGYSFAAARIREERARLDTRAYVDALHGAVLHLCSAYADRSIYTRNPAVNSLSVTLRKFDSCGKLLRPFDVSGGDGWRRYFRSIDRPDVMDRWQAQRLIDAMRVAVPSELFSEGLINCTFKLL